MAHTLFIHKAHDMGGYEEPEDLVIVATAQMPHRAGDWRHKAIMRADAVQIKEALDCSVPGGTVFELYKLLHAYFYADEGEEVEDVSVDTVPAQTRAAHSSEPPTLRSEELPDVSKPTICKPDVFDGGWFW